MSSDPYFVFQQGALFWRLGAETTRYSDVSVLFDSADGTVLKYGSPDKIEKYYQQFKARVKNYADLFEGLMVITFHPSSKSAQELSKIITISGYVNKFCKSALPTPPGTIIGAQPPGRS